MRQFYEFVRSELTELESKDVDQLFGCIRDNLQEMGVVFDIGLDDELYSELETQLKKKRIANN